MTSPRSKPCPVVPLFVSRRREASRPAHRYPRCEIVDMEESWPQLEGRRTERHPHRCPIVGERRKKDTEANKDITKQNERVLLGFRTSSTCRRRLVWTFRRCARFPATPVKTWIGWLLLFVRVIRRSSGSSWTSFILGLAYRNSPHSHG